jgi:hypothetical protein
LGALAILVTLTFPIPAAAEPLEYAVKAAYLSKFGVYVEWPSSAFSRADGPMNLCVIGEDPFGPILDEAAGGQRIGGRPIVVRRLRTIARDSGCHIVYIGSGEAQRTGHIIDVIQGGVLTVTDGRAPGTASGVINFVIRDNRVRFEIDEQAAALNGLSISSKLLSLAVNVKPRR